MTRLNEHEARELLPWYAANALEPGERAAVEEALEASPSLREELAQLRVLEETVADTAGEPRWNPALITRTLERVERHESERAAAAQRPGPVARLRQWLQEAAWPGGWAGVPPLARAVMVAQLALLLAVGGAWLARPRSGPAGSYSTVGRAEQTISIGFRPDVDEATLRGTLREIGGTIVDGPSALGLYTVAVPQQGPALDTLLEQLRARPDVIRYAERRR